VTSDGPGTAASREKREGLKGADAGYIVQRAVFDGDTFLSIEVVVNKGPHPEADSDFELFCQIMPGALGL
jgi:hypothetical protein